MATFRFFQDGGRFNLSINVPTDVVIDYQLNEVTGQSMNIFESDVDLKAFPELLPTGDNGIKDSMREFKKLPPLTS